MDLTAEQQVQPGIYVTDFRSSPAPTTHPEHKHTSRHTDEKSSQPSPPRSSIVPPTSSSFTPNPPLR